LRDRLVIGRGQTGFAIDLLENVLPEQKTDSGSVRTVPWNLIANRCYFDIESVDGKV
jgi:hypothetical protein